MPNFYRNLPKDSDPDSNSTTARCLKKIENGLQTLKQQSNLIAMWRALKYSGVIVNKKLLNARPQQKQCTTSLSFR